MLFGKDSHFFLPLIACVGISAVVAILADFAYETIGFRLRVVRRTVTDALEPLSR